MTTKLKPILLIAAALAILWAGCSEPVFEGPFQVPDGFIVESVADPEAVGSLIQVTFDSLGRPVVSKERDHPTRLLDNDGDGIFETQQVVSDQVENCHGLWFDGPTLYAVCTNPDDGKACLFKLGDSDGDGQADSREIIVQFLGEIREHGPHDIRRGPDGIPTLMLGNHTFIPAEQITASPLANYKESQLLTRYMDALGHAVGRKAPGGSLFRVDLEAEQFTLLFGGFRNAYNHAYNQEGEVFTFDSDMERDINLPWYREIRTVHGVPGADYGWRTGSGKFAPYFLDTLPAIADHGRGSPVGLDFYHHYAYPAEYFDSLIQGDWSRGRVLRSKFENAGATYKLAAEPDVFVYGEPLNVTDLEIGPDGFVYFTMGGRLTAGGFYRIAYKGRRANWSRLPEDGVLAAVRQPQPLSAWGYAALLEKKEQMGEAWGPGLQQVALDENAETDDRIGALYLLQRHAPRPDAILLGKLLDSPEERVRAAAAYVVGLHGSKRAQALAVRTIQDPSPLVQRRGAEAVLRMSQTLGVDSFPEESDLYALLASDDRFVRWAGRLALENKPRDEWKDLVVEEERLTAAPEGMLALIRTAEEPIDLEPVFEKTLSMLRNPDIAAGDELRLLRAFSLACLELEDGCRESLRSQLYDAVASHFPSDDERLNRELASVMAYSGAPGAIEKILAAMPPGDDNQPLQIHYAYCLREIKQGWTPEQKERLVAWFQTALKWRGGASLPGFINRMFDDSLEFFDETEKKMAYEVIPEFAPIDDEAVLARLRRREGFQVPNVFARRSENEGVSEQEIFESMMFDPTMLKASPEAGRTIFEKQCAKCHLFGDQGKDYGPDLTTLPNRFTRRDMVEAVLFPSKEISDQYESSRIRIGYEVFEGLILEEDETSVTVMLPEEERPVKFSKDKITDITVSEVSIMPEGLMDRYNMRQIGALFAYLQRGPEQPRSMPSRVSFEGESGLEFVREP